MKAKLWIWWFYSKHLMEWVILRSHIMFDDSHPWPGHTMNQYDKIVVQEIEVEKP